MTAEPEQVRFGLTNFEVLIPYGAQLVFTLRHAGQAVSCQLSPVVDHYEVMQRVTTLSATDVTAEVAFELTGRQTVADLSDTTSDLCNLLSVARGTKVQWIYRDLYGGSGNRLSRTHSSRHTMIYSMFHTIAPGVHGLADLQKFVHETFPTYMERRDSWRLREMIDGYLDAKTPTGFTELRGVKLAVVVEMLKDQYLSLPDVPIGEHLVLERVFKRIRPQIRAAVAHSLESEDLGEETRQSILDKLPELNRRSFRSVIEHMSRYLELELGHDLRTLINSRNSLVHTGEFYCTTATAKQRAGIPAFTNYLHEYLFLISVLDRMFLRLLGYSGPYVDWQVPGEPTRRPLTADESVPAEPSP